MSRTLYQQGRGADAVLWADHAYLPHEVPEHIGDTFWISRSGSSRGVRIKKGIIVPGFCTDADVDDIDVLKGPLVALHDYQQGALHGIVDVTLEHDEGRPIVRLRPLEHVSPCYIMGETVRREYDLQSDIKMVEGPSGLFDLVPPMRWLAAHCPRADVALQVGRFGFNPGPWPLICHVYYGRVLREFSGAADAAARYDDLHVAGGLLVVRTGPSMVQRDLARYTILVVDSEKVEALYELSIKYHRPWEEQMAGVVDEIFDALAAQHPREDIERVLRWIAQDLGGPAAEVPKAGADDDDSAVETAEAAV